MSQATNILQGAVAAPFNLISGVFGGVFSVVGNLFENFLIGGGITYIGIPLMRTIDTEWSRDIEQRLYALGGFERDANGDVDLSKGLGKSLLRSGLAVTAVRAPITIGSSVYNSLQESNDAARRDDPENGDVYAMAQNAGLAAVIVGAGFSLNEHGRDGLEKIGLDDEWDTLRDEVTATAKTVAPEVFDMKNPFKGK